MIRLYRLKQGRRHWLFGAPSLLLVERYLAKEIFNRRKVWIEAEGAPATFKRKGPKPRQQALF